MAHGLSCSTACGSSWSRDRTRVPCTGRRILNHCATREAQGNVYILTACLCGLRPFFPLRCSLGPSGSASLTRTLDCNNRVSRGSEVSETWGPQAASGMLAHHHASLAHLHSSFRLWAFCDTWRPPGGMGESSTRQEL